LSDFFSLLYPFFRTKEDESEEFNLKEELKIVDANIKKLKKTVSIGICSFFFI
jgi:hypothetical protein